MSLRVPALPRVLRALLLSLGAGLACGACTSLTIEPRNAHEGVVIGYAWSFNIITVTVPLDPRERALALVGGARLSDVRNAEIEEWPDFIWPFSWLNGLLGFCAAEVRAEYGLPPPSDAPLSEPPDGSKFPAPPAEDSSASEGATSLRASGAP
ncbi:MAG: hypothetical protein JNM84_07870 [Planctomycetes bacterium]|nr:hypothetical protein [Planctomycetota bacterium]